MAAEEVNAAGGINVGGEKRKIELLKKDDNSELSLVDAVNAFKSLLTVDKVDFVVGGHRSESVMAMMDMMASQKIVFVNSGAGSPQIMERVGKEFEKYKYMFRTQTNNKLFTPLMAINGAKVCADALQEELGISKPRVALLIEKTMAGEAFVRAAREALPKLGLEIIGEWRPSALATDMTPELTAIKVAGAHMIFDFFPGSGGVALSRGWGELQIPATLGGISIEPQSLKYWKTTEGLCNYELTVTGVGPANITEKTMPYLKNFIKRTGDTPGYPGPTTYDGLYVLKEAIERAGSIQSDAVINAMEKTDYRGVMGRIAFYPRGHEAPHDMILEPGYVTNVGNQWQDGKIVVVSPTGRIALGDKRWQGLRYEGTVNYKLPPWLVKYWKSRKEQK